MPTDRRPARGTLPEYMTTSGRRETPWLLTLAT
nr:MAG TPA: hypothetical protein [Caudoviricetes sp.]